MSAAVDAEDAVAGTSVGAYVRSVGGTRLPLSDLERQDPAVIAKYRSVIFTQQDTLM